MSLSKKTIGVFVDHDLFIRNFYLQKFFPLSKKYNVIYIFPDESDRPGKRRRITKGIFKI